MTKVVIDEYGPKLTPGDFGAVIFLCGSGGVRSANFPFARQVNRFANSGRRVYVPHYLDVTRGDTRSPALHYRLWAQTVRDAIQYIQAQTNIPLHRMAIVGYSLGASVALSVGTFEPQLSGIVVWSGSLPDAYRDVNQLPPLLILHGGRDPIIPIYNARQLGWLCTLNHFRCTLSIYPEEGHAFSAQGIARADSEIQAFLDHIIGPL